MNKKGFTLIELLGVILIISLLVLIVLPRITNSINNFSPKTDKLMMNMLEDAAKLYIEDNASKFDKSLYDYSCLSINELIDKEYLKEGIEISGKDIAKNKILKITYGDNYKIELVNNNECIVIPDPGLYDQNNVLLATWDELVEKGFDIESDFNSSTSSNNINILNSYGSKYKLIVDGSITKIGNYALYNCRNLIEIILTNKIMSIGNYAFYNCTGLTNITIPGSVTSIGNYAFYYCSGLTSIKISNGLISIGSNAFYYCSKLTSIMIPSSVTSIGSSVFASCSKLTSIIVDENNSVYDSRDNSNAIIETASNTLIAGCKNTVIPNDATSIGYRAFYGCSELASITIPGSVRSIGDQAFSGCSGLASIVVDENNSVYDSRENSNAIIETASNTLIAGCKNTVIPNSVTSIGNNAFYNCNTLTSITIPNSVKSIGNDAFWQCSGLTSISISNSVTSIGNYAFEHNRALTSITIPSSVTSIGNGVFNGCTKLQNIIVDENNSIYDSRNNSNAIIETASNKLITGCKNTVIPNSVTSIGDQAFYQSGLTSIIIPNSVTSIGNNAFGYSSSLTNITISESVTSIGNGTFNGCSKLTTIYYSGTATGSPWGAPSATVVPE